MLPIIAAGSYFSSAVAFLFLSVLLLTSWRGRLHGMVLTSAVVLTAIWAFAAGILALNGTSLALLTDVLEIVRNAAWTLFLLSVLGQLRKNRTCSNDAVALPLGILTTFYLLALATTISLYDASWFSQWASSFTVNIAGRLVMAVLNMLLVEHLYRSTTPEARWAIKFACLGMGGLFAYDMYLYSDAMLFRHVSIEIWSARGLANALTVPLIAVSAARNPSWSTSISVSRTMLFHSATVLGSAAYLLAMAAAGYCLRLFGGEWGPVMQVAFLFGAGILLLAILFSGSMRAWLKVFISKHFYSYRYDYREEWMRFTRSLSDAGTSLNERTLQAVAQLMESPAGILFLRRENTSSYEQVTCWNMLAAQRAEPFQGPFCRYLEQQQWVIDVPEAMAEPDKYGGLVLPAWLCTLHNAWLVVPLLLGHQLFGFMVLAQARSKVMLNWEATDLLKIAGMQAASYLAQRESADALMVARQFESYTRMSTFIVHDLKNLISQLSLLLSNAERHKGNVAFQEDMLETVAHSVQKMTFLLQKLSRSSSQDSPVPVQLQELLRQAIGLKSSTAPRPTLQIDDTNLFVLADYARLERVLGHLIQNAVEATPRHGTVSVCVRRQGRSAIIEIRDSGHGMTPEFIRDRLFKPFESTKLAGMGIGAYESRTYIHELGGDINVSSKPSVGTTFRVSLPILQQEGQAVATTVLQEEST